VKEKGYISVLNERLKKEGGEGLFQLIGSGIGGNKIYDLYFRLEKDVISKNPDIVVIWIGVNDVWHKSSFGTGSDLHKFEPMYVDLIQKLAARGIQVYCATPACIGEKTDFSNAQDGDLNEFSKAIRKIAKNNQAGLLDFRQLFLDYNLKHNPKNLPNGILTYDGVHLNDDGNALVADAVWKQVLFPVR
jgi:lysophospholipase L1-like esterase